MKVLHVVTAWPRHEGDVITPWLAETLRALRAEDVDCEVLAPAYRGGGARLVGGIRVFRFRYAWPRRLETLTHDEATPDRLARNPALALLLPGYVGAGCVAAARLQRGRHYDVVHVHWAVPHGLMGLAARAAGARALVTTFYGAELRWAESRFPPGRAFLKLYCRRGTLVAISSATRGALARYTARPVHIVPYAAALEPLPEAAAQAGPPGERAPEQNGAPAPDTVLFVGRLVARKGLPNLLHAAARSRVPYRVAIVGAGPEEARLRDLTSALGLGARVEFTGRVERGELARRYARADVFVLPATLDERGDTEGLGVVLLEALAHGVPVVATRRGGIPDVVKDGETGLLVEDGDLDGLARAIDRLLEDRALAERLTRQGREHLQRCFSAASVAGRLARIYREAVEMEGGAGGRASAGAAAGADAPRPAEAVSRGPASAPQGGPA